MSELEEKVERIAEVLVLTWKLAKAVKRGHNRVTRIFNSNFDVFEDKVNRNSINIDKIVKTLEELMGEKSEKPIEKKIENSDIRRLFL